MESFGAANRHVCMSGAYNLLAVNPSQGCVHARTQGRAADHVDQTRLDRMHVGAAHHQQVFCCMKHCLWDRLWRFHRRLYQEGHRQRTLIPVCEACSSNMHPARICWLLTQILQAIANDLYCATHMPAVLYAFETCLMTDSVVRLGKTPQPFQGALTANCAGRADGPDGQRKA